VAVQTDADPKSVVQLTPAQLAKLEKKVAARHRAHAKAGHAPHILPVKAHHAAHHGKAIQHAAAATPVVLGGAMALAGLKRAGADVEAGIAPGSAALGQLDQKLQRRRFKKWDDILRG
jgi:hypothetical protein